MLCDRCKKRQANIQITQVAGGRQTHKNLCTVCAQELAGGATGAELGFPGFFDIPEIFANLLRRRPQDRMYDFFSDSARKVIHLAKEEAVRLSHDMIYPEHLLLGLVKEEGFAYKVFGELKIDLVELFSAIESLMGRGNSKSKEAGLSPRAKRILEMADRVAQELGFNYVGSEHILLGIIREGESIAAQALAKRGVTFEKTAKAMMKSIQEGEEESEKGDAESGAPEEEGVGEEYGEV